MRPIFFIIFCVSVMIVTLLALTTVLRSNPDKIVKDDSVISKKAVELYQKNKAQNVDLSNGPCLGTIDNYAIDIAHTPREEVDERPENQCPDYNSGKLKHFVELTPFGTIIRVK